MNEIRLTCPSKTFFIGEYAILHGAPAFILNTQPRFAMSFTKRHIPSFSFGRIHPQSPAGRWMRRYADVFRYFKPQFYDPHRYRGGCGASTAQFLSAYVFSKWQSYGNKLPEINPEDLLRDYLSVAWSGQGTAPSGADLISQFHGHITYFDRRAFKIETLQWPFADLSFLVVRTGHKIATHHHLQSLKPFAIEEFKNLCDQLYQAFKNKHKNQVIEIVNAYHQALHEHHFVADKTMNLLTTLKKWPEVLAIKGCGAMGADTLFLLCLKENLSEVKNKLRAHRLHYIADESHLTTGIELRSTLKHKDIS